MIGPDRWPAIAAASLRDKVPRHLLEDAIGAGVLRLAELHATGYVFEKPSHAGKIAYCAGVDFVRETLGRKGQKYCKYGVPMPDKPSAREEAAINDRAEDRARLDYLHERAKLRYRLTAHRRVLVMLEAGFTRQEIAADLGVHDSRVHQMIDDLRALVA